MTLGEKRPTGVIYLLKAIKFAAFALKDFGLSGLPRALVEWIDSPRLSPLVPIVAPMVFYIVIGCFPDGSSSVVPTMAVVKPIIRQAGITVIRFGSFAAVVVEMARITPPIGFNLFVLQGTTRHEISTIARTALPMFMLKVVMAGILDAVPEIVTWLPENLRAPLSVLRPWCFVARGRLV